MVRLKFWARKQVGTQLGRETTAVMQYGKAQAWSYAASLNRVRRLTQEYFTWRTQRVRGKGPRLARVELRRRIPDAGWFWGEHLPQQISELNWTTRNTERYLSRANRAIAALRAGNSAKVNTRVLRSKTTVIIPAPEVMRRLPDFEESVLRKIAQTRDDAQTLKNAFETALAKQRGKAQQ